MHWQRHKQGPRARRRSGARRIPVAVAIGTDPVAHVRRDGAAAAGVDEFAFAGLLRGKPVELVQAKTVDLMVPADAEFVLEGYVDNDDCASRARSAITPASTVWPISYPTFHVTCLTHRRDPIYAATVVGKPPMEDAWLGKATERIFLPLLQMVLPEVVDMNLPVEGGFHNLAIVSIKKSYPGHAKKVMNALWGLGHMMMLTRMLVDRRCRRRRAGRARRGVVRAQQPRARTRSRDDAGSGRRSRSRIVQQSRTARSSASTRRARTHREGYTREWPPDIVMDEATRARVDDRWREYGLDRIARRLRPDDWSGQGPPPGR